MDLPIRVFWELSGNVERLRAEESVRQVRIGTAIQTPENVETMLEHLEKIAPPPFKMSGQGLLALNAEPDAVGLDELRSLASFI